MNKMLFFVSASILLLLASCQSDVQPMEELKLEGNWNLYEAYRNNSLTTTLQDGYFIFKDSTMETNILGSPVSGKFKMLKGAFLHESELPATYGISYFSDDTIHLKTEIQGFEFLFKLQKTQDSLSTESM